MRILFAYTPGFTEEMYREFEALGLEPVLLSGPETDHYELDFSDIELVVCYRFFLFNEIERFTALKYIHTTSSGIDHMPLDYIRSHGITLCNARGVYSEPMAEYALGSVLRFYRGAELLRAQQAAHRWETCRELRELSGKQVTILGAGSVGSECAKRFSVMGCSCVGLCRHPDKNAPHYTTQLHVDHLDEVLPETDILLLTLPLTDETRGIMDARRFSLLKEGAVLVNIARGPVADTAAMVEALASGRLSGAAVDVFDVEPLPEDSPLWDTENLIITPHNSFIGEHNPRRMFALIYQDTVNWLNSKGGNA